jgi:hypothetical protein
LSIAEYRSKFNRFGRSSAETQWAAKTRSEAIEATEHRGFVITTLWGFIGYIITLSGVGDSCRSRKIVPDQLRRRGPRQKLL